MKKILTILFFLAFFMIPAQGQIFEMLGGAALKAVGKGAGNAVMNSVSERLETKAENAVTKVINKTFGEVEKDTLSTSAVTGIGAIGQVLNSVSSNIAAIEEKSMTAGAAALRDFSVQNAARREHNLTLVYDDWD